MEDVTGTAWQRMGSSIVFDRECLGPLITAGAYVSLRRALAWRKSLPPLPPVAGRTIVIYGLETMIELLPPVDCAEFLATRVRPLVMDLQGRWTNCGIVFAFSATAKSFEETKAAEEVLFLRRDQKTVHLSEGLWDGSAGMNMRRLVLEESRLVGYHVTRIS